MYVNVLFQIIYIIRFSFQIELTDSIELTTITNDPVVFVRYSKSHIFLSTKSVSLIYDLQTKTNSGNFDTDLDLFSQNIRSIFNPQIFDSEGSLVYYYMSSSNLYTILKIKTIRNPK